MKSWIASVLLLALLGIIQENLADELLVKLNHGGRVQGSIMKSQKGKKIYAFRGIPYAEPPIGDKRFKPPVPKGAWKGAPHDATTDGPVCIQFEMLVTKELIGQEDCLYLNVYTPELPDDDDDDDDDDDKRAVLVFIHGGGFIFGHASSDMYGPGKLLDGNIVLVTMNYRLGPLGFLSTSDDAARGNYGLMDQSLALKWVQENIDAFGGDTSRVAIFGESAGAASVGYHLLSPMSSGYFQAAISESGSPLCSWGFQEEPMFWTKKLATELKCSTDTSAEIVECLRGVSAKDITEKSLGLISHGVVILIFVPTLDGTFISMEPREAMRSGKIANKVPFITGINKDEGIFDYLSLRHDDPAFDMTSKKYVSEIIKLMLDEKGRSDEPSDLVAQKYFGSIDMNEGEVTRKAVIRSFSDATFDICHYETVKLLSQHGIQTYAYSLDYAPSVGLSSLFGVQNLGVSHGDDLYLLFDGAIFGSSKPSDDDKKITKVIRTLWTNLAKYGNPTPNTTKLLPLNWKPSGADGKVQVLHINTHMTTSIYDTAKEELYHFWTEKVQKALEKTIQRQTKEEL